MTGALPDTLNGLDAEARLALETRALNVHLKAGQAVFAPGRPCTDFLVVAAGSIKVTTATEGGRELVLYRVGPGESCVITTACLMAGSEYDAYGVAEADCDAVVVPRPLFEELLQRSATFRRYVFTSYGERLSGLIGLIQEVALRQVDRRLARFIAAAAGDEIALTHQAIAGELGTAREVVSRLLKHFEEQGLIQLERRRIVVLNRGKLTQIAGNL